MTRDEFLEAVRVEGISSLSFKIGEVSNERYVLLDREGHWDVFYSERGQENDLRQFPEEPLALSDLLARLRADPTTRQ